MGIHGLANKTSDGCADCTLRLNVSHSILPGHS